MREVAGSNPVVPTISIKHHGCRFGSRFALLFPRSVMMRIGLLLFLVILLPVNGSVKACFDQESESRSVYPQDSATGICSQPVTEQRSLVTEAETQKFTVRRVEFVGLTYTRDEIIRDRMTPLVNEGDLFSRKKLIKSLQSMSRNKAVYPVRMSDVVLYLDRTERLVDMTICFRQRNRR